MEVISMRYALKNGKGLFITRMFLKKIVVSFFSKHGLYIPNILNTKLRI